MPNPLEPIATGAQFPEGAVTRDGTCSRCTARRLVAVTWLRTKIMPDAVIKELCCAECVTDFACAAGEGPFCCETYVESRQADGGTRMQLVRAADR